jgi:hypothetical protein
MTSLGEAHLHNSRDEWEPLWMAAEPFRLREGLLLDLSVEPAEEIALRRSRWNAVVIVGLPDWFVPKDELGLANFVDAHLRGRDPMTGSHDGALLITFAVPDDSDVSHDLAARFADSFVRADVFGEAARRKLTSGVVYTDTADIDHLLPEDTRPLE